MAGMRVKELQERLVEAGRRAGFRMMIYGEVGGIELPAFVREAAEDAPRVYLSAGVHGDEPAGPLAILELFRKKLLPESVQWSVVPLVNPLGLEKGTRENLDGVDLNRDYGATPQALETQAHKAWLTGRAFDLAFCLHEDFEATGGYLYEITPLDEPSHARPLLEAMRPHVGIDPAEEIDGMPASNGLMAPPRDVLLPERDDLPEALLLYFQNQCPRVYTLETPSAANIVQRVAAQTAAVLAAIDLFTAGCDRR